MVSRASHLLAGQNSGESKNLTEKELVELVSFPSLSTPPPTPSIILLLPQFCAVQMQRKPFARIGTLATQATKPTMSCASAGTSSLVLLP